MSMMMQGAAEVRDYGGHGVTGEGSQGAMSTGRRVWRRLFHGIDRQQRRHLVGFAVAYPLSHGGGASVGAVPAQVE
jgi:hypothetical protein